MAYKPWEKLYDVWNSIFTRDLSKEVPHPTSLSGAGIGRADAVGNSEYLEGGSTFNHAVEITELNDYLEVGEHTDRRARYLEYDRMENIPEISSSLDTYADEITIPDTERKVFEIRTENQFIKDELEWLFNDHLRLNSPKQLWSWARNFSKNGDLFIELIINQERPELGIQKAVELPPETMYRIETVRGRLLEFQQSYKGPDYQVVLQSIKDKTTQADQAVGHLPSSSPVTTTGTIPSQQFTSEDSTQVIRFDPNQVVHLRLGLNRRGFYPYGVSVLYAGRRVAHLLKLMEDAMVIYRLSRAPERRIFYIDIGTLPPHKGEQVLTRIKDKIKKRRVFNRRTNQIDERYNAWAADEDFFIPTRPESNTRIETLPGGQNLGEIDDTKYFREKLMVALKLPKNYLFQEDVSLTRTSFATQDMRFARTIYRIQEHIAEAIKEIAIRHLTLKGFPDDEIKKIKVMFTSPSDWLELSRSELLNNRYNLAGSIKGSQLYDDFTILTKILGHTKEEALEIIDKLEKQILRTQEITAQAQIFAQLATPDMDGGQQPPVFPGGEMNPQLPQGSEELPPLGGEEEFSGNEQVPGIEQGSELPPIETDTDSEKETENKEEEPEERFSDFSDLEADQEEIDINYNEGYLNG